MQIAALLHEIDTGAIALPEFQRGYVWQRRQVRELVDSLYRRFPVGALLMWKTEVRTAATRGAVERQDGRVSLLLDGQQRITSLYGLIRGTPPPFFDGDERAFTDLRFHPRREELAFYAPVTMRDDPLWLDVSTLLGDGGDTWVIAELQRIGVSDELATFLARATRLRGIRDIDLHAEELPGQEMDIEQVVDLFNKVNSAGTKLSNGDLTLAKLCAQDPGARDAIKQRQAHWEGAGFDFSIDWVLRNVTAVVTRRAEVVRLGRVDPETFRQGLDDSERAIGAVLDLVSSRLGLDHGRVLGAVGAFPLMSAYVARRGGRITDGREADRLLYWYVNALLWGRYAGSTETVLNSDLQALDATEPLEALVEQLRRARGGTLAVRPEDFAGSTVGARFYPLLYMLTRVEGARDLGTGLELRRHMLGRDASLEVHHLFPKAVLQEHDYPRGERNAIANFSFLTATTNRSLGASLPAEYLPAAEAAHPGVLASHWIPSDEALWHPDRYPAFLLARRELLAEAANRLLGSLWDGRDAAPLEESVLDVGTADVQQSGEDEDEDVVIRRVTGWLHEQGLEAGIRDFAVLGLDGRSEEAVLDVAWPDGLRYGANPIALLLDEPPEVHEAATRWGFSVLATEAALRDRAEVLLREEA